MNDDILARQQALTLASQKALTNFYETVQFQNPAMAYLMSADVRTVALYGISGNRTQAYHAVRKLRRLAEGLSSAQVKILDRALEELGYSLEDVDREYLA